MGVDRVHPEDGQVVAADSNRCRRGSDRRLLQAAAATAAGGGHCNAGPIIEVPPAHDRWCGDRTSGRARHALHDLAARRPHGWSGDVAHGAGSRRIVERGRPDGDGNTPRPRADGRPPGWLWQSPGFDITRDRLSKDQGTYVGKLSLPVASPTPDSSTTAASRRRTAASTRAYRLEAYSLRSLKAPRPARWCPPSAARFLRTDFKTAGDCPPSAAALKSVLSQIQRRNALRSGNRRRKRRSGRPVTDRAHSR